MADNDNRITARDLVFGRQEAASGRRFNVERCEKCAIDGQGEREPTLSRTRVQIDAQVPEGHESLEALRSLRNIVHFRIGEISYRVRLRGSHEADDSTGLRNRYRADQERIHKTEHGSG